MHVGIPDAFRALPLALAVCLMGAQPATAQVNPFGDSLDLMESDVAMLQAAASALFEDDKAQVGHTNTWSNPETGNSGEVSLLQLFEHASMPCKRLQHTIRQKGHADQSTYRFARCRAADGSWKLF